MSKISFMFRRAGLDSKVAATPKKMDHDFDVAELTLVELNKVAGGGSKPGGCPDDSLPPPRKPL